MVADWWHELLPKEIADAQVRWERKRAALMMHRAGLSYHAYPVNAHKRESQLDVVF